MWLLCSESSCVQLQELKIRHFAGFGISQGFPLGLVAPSQHRVGRPMLYRLLITWSRLTTENSAARKVWDEGLVRRLIMSFEEDPAPYVNFQLRRQMWRYSSDAASKTSDYILVFATNHDERSSWYQAAQYAIRCMCNTSGLSKLSVEIAVERSWDLPVVQEWPLLELQGRIILRRTGCVSINPVRWSYERVEPHNPPTVCIL